MFFYADVVVTAAIKGTAGNTTKVTHAGQRDGHEAVEEFVHLHATQSDHATNRLLLADFETSDRLLSLGHHGLLACNFGQVADSVVHDLFIGYGFANTHVQGDFG